MSLFHVDGVVFLWLLSLHVSLRIVIGENISALSCNLILSNIGNERNNSCICKNIVLIASTHVLPRVDPFMIALNLLTIVVWHHETIGCDQLEYILNKKPIREVMSLSISQLQIAHKDCDAESKHGMQVQC